MVARRSRCAHRAHRVLFRLQSLEEEDEERFRKQFSSFLEDDISSEDIEDMYRCVQDSLLALLLIRPFPMHSSTLSRRRRCSPRAHLVVVVVVVVEPTELTPTPSPPAARRTRRSARTPRTPRRTRPTSRRGRRRPRRRTRRSSRSRSAASASRPRRPSGSRRASKALALARGTGRRDPGDGVWWDGVRLGGVGARGGGRGGGLCPLALLWLV